MNPQHVLFVKLSESVVSAVPETRQSEFQISISEGDMIGFIAGVLMTFGLQLAYRVLRKRPVRWYRPESGRVTIGDLDRRDDVSGDCLLPMDSLQGVG